MTRYILNKLNKITQNLQKKHLEPIQILYVTKNNNEIYTSLTFGGNFPKKKQHFKTEEELKSYIQENDIKNTITGVFIEKIWDIYGLDKKNKTHHYNNIIASS